MISLPIWLFAILCVLEGLGICSLAVVIIALCMKHKDKKNKE